MRLAYLLACAALPLVACTDLPSGSDSFVEPDLSATLRVPLTAEDEAGVVYRLRNVDLEITGSALLAMSDRDGIRARESLSTQLPAGEYTVFLKPGWRLMARDSAGHETLAEAELLSSNPFTVRVNELGDEILGLVFKQGDKQLRFGPGSAVRITSLKPEPKHSTL